MMRAGVVPMHASIRRRIRNVCGGVLATIVVTSPRSSGPALPPPRFDLFRSAAPRVQSWPPPSTLHEAWHVALPAIAYRLEIEGCATGWDPHWRPKVVGDFPDQPLPWLAVHGGAALIHACDPHWFDARTGRAVTARPGGRPGPLLLLAEDHDAAGRAGTGEVKDLSTRRTLWTRPLSLSRAFDESSEFASTLRGPGTRPDVGWTGRASVRIRAVEVEFWTKVGGFLGRGPQWLFRGLDNLANHAGVSLDLPSYRVTATAYDPVTGQERWKRDLGTHIRIAHAWNVHPFQAMADDRRLYVLSYTHFGQMDAYDLADGHPLWSTPDTLPTMAESEPPLMIEGDGTLNILRRPRYGPDDWMIVHLDDGKVESSPTYSMAKAEAALFQKSASGNYLPAELLGDVVYRSVEGEPIIEVIDAVSGKTIRRLHVDGPPDEAVDPLVHTAKFAVGTLDDGQPVLITYWGGVLRGWLRGP
jgi:hypothetical protein